MSALQDAIQKVVDDYFPEPGSLFIDQDERRGPDDLVADLVGALLEVERQMPGVCRLCGCTDDESCDGGCYWVEADLCSECAP